jgi:ABC-type transport system involved in multi-copper enzyme maturation permease subunit
MNHTIGSALNGVRTVARLEFRLRIRAGRWRWMVTAWFVLLLGITGLVRASLTERNLSTEQVDARGAVMFGVVMLIVLALALLVSPALAAQSVNGDRERGTLATLQVTRLRAGEIALGKLLASWGTALVFLAVTLPLTLWCYAEGGLSVLRVFGVYLVMALLLGVVCSLSLGLSALLARSTTSGVLAYLTVFALSVGTFIAFGLATVLTQEHATASSVGCSYDESGNEVPGSCTPQPYETSVPRTDRTWWLLAPNPFAVLADSAPAGPTRDIRQPDGRVVQEGVSLDPLGAMSRALHQIRVRPTLQNSGLGTFYDVPDGVVGSSVWPTGLVIDLLLGAGAAWVTARRLRTPTYKLARGQRIA